MRQADMAEKLVLFLCCSIALLLQPAGEPQVVPLIISAGALGLISYFDSFKTRNLVAGVYVLLCFFFMPLCFFMPVITYANLDKRSSYFMLLGLLPLAFATALTAADRLLILLLTLLAALLKLKAINIDQLRDRYLKLFDANREISLRLKRQNQSLLERQNEEVRLATLNERNRIAREIHDHVGHQLSSALLQVGALLAAGGESPPLLALKDTLSRSMDSVRSSVHNLHDRSIDLHVSIAALVNSFTFCAAELIFRFETDPEPGINYAFIAIVKEALANIAKHSTATQVRLSFLEHPVFYQLIISDNGKVANYDPDGGIGLKNIAQRVESLEGRFLIRTQNGFELFITIPKQP